MRILLINTTEKIGGPAVAASRLMEALKNNGIKANRTDHRSRIAPQPAHGMEIRMGTNRYLEGQSLQ